jgi:hypothetical protein
MTVLRIDFSFQQSAIRLSAISSQLAAFSNQRSAFSLSTQHSAFCISAFLHCCISALPSGILGFLPFVFSHFGFVSLFS